MPRTLWAEIALHLRTETAQEIERAVAARQPILVATGEWRGYPSHYFRADVIAEAICSLLPPPSDLDRTALWYAWMARVGTPSYTMPPIASVWSGEAHASSTSVQGRVQPPSPGLLAMAHAGVLYVEEVCGLTPIVTVAIAQAVHEGVAFRVGGAAPYAARVQVVAATTRDPHAFHLWARQSALRFRTIVNLAAEQRA